MLKIHFPTAREAYNVAECLETGHSVAGQCLTNGIYIYRKGGNITGNTKDCFQDNSSEDKTSTGEAIHLSMYLYALYDSRKHYFQVLRLTSSLIASLELHKHSSTE